MRSHFIRKPGKLEEEDEEEEEGEGEGRERRRRRRHSSITYGKSKRSSKEEGTVLLARGRDYKSVGKASLNLNSYQKDTSLPSCFNSGAFILSKSVACSLMKFLCLFT